MRNHTISKPTIAAITACLAWTNPTILAAPEKGVPFDGLTIFRVEAEQIELPTEAMTVSAWVKVANNADPQVFLNVNDANQTFTFYLYKQKVRMLVAPADSDYAYATAAPPVNGQWTHYAGTYDGKMIKIYKDGRLAGSCPAHGKIAPAKGALYIGGLNEWSRILSGLMTDVGLWNRALDADDVAQLAQTGLSPNPAAGLIGYWSAATVSDKGWSSHNPGGPTAQCRVRRKQLINKKDDGYRGIWYFNQPSGDEYVYKYSGGLATYCAKHRPFAIYVKQADKTFFTYGGAPENDSRRLLHMASYYDHATGQVPRPTIVLDKETEDAHDNPVISIDDRGYVYIFSSSHGTARPSYISRSKKPCSVDEFELIWTGNFSYPQPWFVPGRGFLLLHTHYTGGRAGCLMTSPDAVHWTPRVFLSRIGEGHYQVSKLYNDRKVGVAFNYHPQGKGLNWRTNLYYMESDDFGATWKNIRGQKLDLMLGEVQNPALVHEYESRGLNVYMKDVDFDAQGRPIILYITSRGYESGPDNMPRTWTTARWTGTRWDIRGGDIVSDNNYDTGELWIESDDEWRIIGPTQTGPQPYNPGGEVAMWLSRDQGRHWKMVRQLTHHSERNHTYCRRPIDAQPDFYALWADGHGRQPSDSRLYFCNKAGDVFQLPTKMKGPYSRPEKINPEKATNK